MDVLIQNNHNLVLSCIITSIIIMTTTLFNVECTIVPTNTSLTSSTTKTTSPGLPLAIPQPRLPSQYSVIEANVTDSYNDVDSHSKNVLSRTKSNTRNSPEDSRINYDASPSNENVIRLVDDGNRNHNYGKKSSDSNAKPFRPSPPAPSNVIPQPEYRENFKEVDGSRFKFSEPAKQEHFYQPHHNNYPMYNEPIDLPYPKYYHEKDNVQFVTTFSPPKVDPMYRPTLLTHKKSKQFAFPYANHEQWRAPGEYIPKYESDFHTPKEYIGAGVGYPIDHHPVGYYNSVEHDLYNKHIYIDKTRRRDTIVQILSTLIPLGLLLTALPPRVVYINATNTNMSSGQNAPTLRDLQQELFQEVQGNNDTTINILQNLGFEASEFRSCNKLKICEAAINGMSSESIVEEQNLWQLISKSSDVIRESLGLEDVFQAILQENCSDFTCTKQ